MFFAKNMDTHFSNKHSGKLNINIAEKSTADAIKTASKNAIQKTAEATGDLTGNKIADKFTNASTELHSKKPKKFYSKELHSEKEQANNEIPKDRNISPQKDNKLSTS